MFVILDNLKAVEEHMKCALNVHFPVLVTIALGLWRTCTLISTSGRGTVGHQV